MPSPELTLVLHNWKRPGQLEAILKRLRQQTIPIQIFVWNNSPVPATFKDADWVVQSSRNAHLNSFFYMAGAASTPFVGRLDDDLCPVDITVFAEALKVLRWQPEDRIIGPYGTVAIGRKSYKEALHLRHSNVRRDRPVDIIRGRCMLLRRAGLVRCNAYEPSPHIDLSMSFDLAGRRRLHHLLPACFRNCFRNFPEDDHGYCIQSQHYPARDALLQAWLAKFEEPDEQTLETQETPTQGADSSAEQSGSPDSL